MTRMESRDDPHRDDPLELARTLRPQAYGKRAADRIREPVVEPQWPGLRVLAAVRADDVVLFDDGEPIDGHDDIRHHLATMLAPVTDGVVLDGYLTKQVVTDTGIYTGFDEYESAGRLVAQSMVGRLAMGQNRTEAAIKRLESATAERTFAPDDLVNLVLTDLLWLDGEWLLGVPLLERKRLLDSLIRGTELVRTGVYVRPPIATWVGSWRAQGFPGLTFKEANSRYRCGERTDEWAMSSMPRR